MPTLSLIETRLPVAPRVLEPEPVHEDREAVEYDAMIERFAWLLNRPFVAMLDRVKGERLRVLDIGTGPGWVPVELAKRHPGWTVTGVDLSDDMLARGRRRACDEGVSSRVRFARGSATKLPFADGAFDLVVSHFVLHHIPQPEVMLAEARRVCSANGGVCVKDLRRLPRWRAGLQLGFSKRVLGYSEPQMAMYRESLAAALTLDEARAAAERSPLGDAKVRGFRGIDFVVTAGPLFGRSW